jgi:hypothetical protein
MAVPDVLARLDSDRTGLAAAEAARRLRVLGPNAVRCGDGVMQPGEDPAREPSGQAVIVDAISGWRTLS